MCWVSKVFCRKGKKTISEKKRDRDILKKMLHARKSNPDVEQYKKENKKISTEHRDCVRFCLVG